MNYFIITFGCQMNKSDSERIAGLLKKIGYQPIDKAAQADLIVVNMCSVRQSAVDRVFGLRNNFVKLKQKKIELKTVLTGCFLKKDEVKFKEQFDVVLKIKDLLKLPKYLGKKTLPDKNYLSVSPSLTSSFFAYVPIMTGCNNFCAYCVVPFARGREISRPAQEIINEIKCLIKKGYKEIILLGQNVNSYQYEKIDFPCLLKKIDELPGKFWLRFITSHPKDLSDKLIEVMARGKKITEYLHLPVQAGDDKILKKMNRDYTFKKYCDLVKKIRNKIDVCLSTDVIVGFPGESKKQFNKTAKLMKQIRFDMAYIAEYSPRADTMAANLRDDVSKREKRERKNILNEILKKTAQQKNKKYLRKTVEVLIEKTLYQNKFGTEQVKNGFCLGKTKTFKNVKIKSCALAPGQFVRIKIIKATPWGLEGLVDPAPNL